MPRHTPGFFQYYSIRLADLGSIEVVLSIYAQILLNTTNTDQYYSIRLAEMSSIE